MKQGREKTKKRIGELALSVELAKVGKDRDRTKQYTSLLVLGTHLAILLCIHVNQVNHINGHE